MIKLSTEEPKAISKPHDTRIKELLGSEDRFLKMLQDCVKEDWVQNIDRETIRRNNTQYILPDFDEKVADLVYEANMNGRKIIFYVLLEHQSKPDYRMPYRLLLYITEILRAYYNKADENERQAKNFKMPVVVPMVLYTGSDNWNVPLELKNIFDSAEQFGENVINFKYMLINVKGYSEEDLESFSWRLLSVIFQLEKSKSDVEFSANVRKSLDYIGGFSEEELRVFNACIKIFANAYGNDNYKEIAKLLNENKIEEADQMLCDVIENAQLERQQVFTQGGFDKSIEIAKKMLAKNYDTDTIQELTDLTVEEIIELQTQ